MLEPLNAPGFQVQVVPPAAVKVADPPVQTDVGLLTAVIVGDGLTVMVIVLVDVQFEAFAPITEQVVVTLGVMVTLVPVKPPGFQV